MTEILTKPADDLIVELQPFNNILPVMISGKHYDRAIREQLLEMSDEQQLAEADIELNRRDIARYKEYEALVKELTFRAGITSEDVQLADVVLRKMKTIVTQGEENQIKDFVGKMKQVEAGLGEYKDLFGAK